MAGVDIHYRAIQIRIYAAGHNTRINQATGAQGAHLLSWKSNNNWWGPSRSSQLPASNLALDLFLYLQFDFQAMLPGPGLHPRAGGGGDEVSTQHYSHNTPLMSIRAVWLLASCGDVFQLKWGM